jgi:hypothetical protein
VGLEPVILLPQLHKKLGSRRGDPGGGGKGQETAQTMYTHMNKQIKKKKKKKKKKKLGSEACIPRLALEHIF